MNTLFRILYAQKCSGTHHRLAMDALRYLKVPNADQWCRLFLAEIEQYIDGSKAPDKKFRDFRNHVLHVGDNFWGGAVPAAELWYARLVHCLRNRDWRRAVYCAGVLTHYVTDPFMPLHTAQTEDEGAVHRMIEWGASLAYRDLVATLPAARGIHNWKPPAESDTSDWLALLIIDGATLANQSYEVLIDHYDPVRGKKNAVDGMDTECREIMAHLLGRCIKALAWILDRAIMESAVEAPSRRVSAATVLSGLSTPVFFLTRKLSRKEDRATVRAILRELQQTGRVIEALPEDDRVVRSAHAAEVLQIDEDELARQRVRRPGTQFRIATPEEQRAKRFRKQPKPRPAKSPATTIRLASHQDVVDAPSIGPKTAARLNAVGIRTVGDLLSADPRHVEATLQHRWITEELFVSWQRQARLMCDVPGLRGLDAQLLVEVGVESKADLCTADAESLEQLIVELAATPDGERILRGGRLPPRAQITAWIIIAAEPRKRAA